MTDTKIFFTEPYENALFCIEDFLYSSSEDKQIIDNRQANLSVYPGNKMPTFDES